MLWELTRSEYALILFQLKEKIIPTFEKYHGAGYKALIIVDNSQGHLAYTTNTLLTSRMNLRPGGKQARLRDGWYLKDNQKVIQAMVLPPITQNIQTSQRE